MDAELNKPLNKNDLVLFEKLKIKWKELSVEVNYEMFKFQLKLNLIKINFVKKGYHFGRALFELFAACEGVL